MREQHRDDPVLIREFAEQAGIARGTIYLWIRAGEVPGFELRAGRYELPRRRLGQSLLAIRGKARSGVRTPSSKSASPTFCVAAKAEAPS